MKKRRYDYDFIRFFAMFGIMIFHINQWILNAEITGSPAIRWVGNLISLGEVFVSVFLILSGATTYMSLTSQFRKSEKTGAAVLEYYKKRWLSIMPSFYIAYFLIHFTFRTVFLPGGKNFIWTVLGLDGYIAIGNSGISTSYILGEWFVGAILLIYLFAPLLYLLIKKFPLVTGILLIVYYFLIVRYYPFTRAIDANFCVKIFDFAIGLYIGKYVEKVPAPAALAGLAVLIINRFVNFHLAGNTFMYMVPVLGTGTFLLLMWIGEKIQDADFSLSRGFQKVTGFLAACSFEIFLIHNVMINKFFGVYTETTMSTSVYFLSMLQLFTEFIFLGFVTHAASVSLKNGLSSLKKAKS